MARTEKEKMLAGEPYLSGDPELAAGRARARRLLRAFNQSDPDDEERRLGLLEELFGSLGPGAWVEPPFFCDYGSFIHAGARLYLNFNCVVLDCNRIEIGDDVLVGPGVHIYAATHPLQADERTSGVEAAHPVRIGSKAWIGGGAIICPGVTIGEGTTIGAGSVVTRDVPDHVLAAGNPCQVIRSLR